MAPIELELPWPPTINTYWRRSGYHIHVSQKGIAYQKSVYYLCHPYRQYFTKQERLSLKIYAYPPDKRRRDIDNITKVLIDSLQKAMVFEDDEQIDELYLVRRIDKNRKGILYICIATL